MTARSATVLPPDALLGQVALVTGASSGLGREAALSLARAGADLILLARSEPDLREEALGRRAQVEAVDLADSAALLGAVERGLETFGRLDILINNAGTDVPGSVVDLSPEDWDRVLGVNLRAPFVLAKVAFPAMQRLGRGTIINVSSVAGKRGWANASAYCASKFGLTGFTQALAAEGKPHGIRACVVYPGGMGRPSGGPSTPAPVTGSGVKARPPRTRCPRTRWPICSPGCARHPQNWSSTR